MFSAPRIFFRTNNDLRIFFQPQVASQHVEDTHKRPQSPGKAGYTDISTTRVTHLWTPPPASDCPHGWQSEALGHHCILTVLGIQGKGGTGVTLYSTLAALATLSSTLQLSACLCQNLFKPIVFQQHSLLSHLFGRMDLCVPMSYCLYDAQSDLEAIIYFFFRIKIDLDKLKTNGYIQSLPNV